MKSSTPASPAPSILSRIPALTKKWKVLSSALTVGGLTLVVKMASTAQHLVVAYRFGTSDALDAFLIALALPMLAVSVFGGALHAAFLPSYVDICRRKGDLQARVLFGEVLTTGGLAIMVVVILLAAGFPLLLPMLCAGFSTTKVAMTRMLFYRLLPVVFFSAFSSLCISALNAGRRFALAALAPLAVPAVVIGFLIAAVQTLGIDALVYGTVCGFAVESLLLGAALLHRGYPFRPRWRLGTATRQVARQFLPMAAGALLMSASELIDKSMAAMLGPGSVAVLSYGSKLTAFLIGVGAFSLATAVFPHFAALVSAKKWDQLESMLRSWIFWLCLICLPLTLLVVVFSSQIVSAAFEHGAFAAADTEVVSRVQALYVLQMPFYITGIMGVRLLSALKKNHVLMAISAVNVVTNIVGNLFCMRYLGVAGISLSTSVVYLISCLLIYRSVSSTLRHEKRKAALQPEVVS